MCEIYLVCVGSSSQEEEYQEPELTSYSEKQLSEQSGHAPGRLLRRMRRRLSSINMPRPHLPHLKRPSLPRIHMPHPHLHLELQESRYPTPSGYLRYMLALFMYCYSCWCSILSFLHIQIAECYLVHILALLLSCVSCHRYFEWKSGVAVFPLILLS